MQVPPGKSIRDSDAVISHLTFLTFDKVHWSAWRQNCKQEIHQTSDRTKNHILIIKLVRGQQFMEEPRAKGGSACPGILAVLI